MFFYHGRPYNPDEIPGPEAVLRHEGHWSIEGLVGYWPMLAGRGGLVRDYSPYGHHGSFVNSPTWCGAQTWGIALNGSSQYIDCGYIAIPSTFSLLSRFVGTDITGPARVLSFFDSASGVRGMIELSENDWIYGVYDNYHYSRWDFPSGYLTGQWMTVASTWDGTSLQLYIDGIDQGSPSKHADPSDDTVDKCYMGVAPRTPMIRYYPGIIEWAGVYSRALSADEIRELYVNPYLPLWKPAAASVWDMAAVNIMPVMDYYYRRRRTA